MRKVVDVWCLPLTGVLFGVFLLNLLIGKSALVFDFQPILHIGDVAEFLILFAAVICFVIEVQRREMYDAGPKTNSAEKVEEETK